MMKKLREERIKEMERRFEEYTDVPPEVTLKDDVLCLGVRFSPAALNAAKDSRKKSCYIFSYNRVAFDEMEKELSHNAHEEMRISSGQYNLRPTGISCRIAIDTPYLIDVMLRRHLFGRCRVFIGAISLSGVF